MNWVGGFGVGVGVGVRVSMSLLVFDWFIAPIHRKKKKKKPRFDIIAVHSEVSYNR